MTAPTPRFGPSRPSRRSRARGFSFVELLFAVAVLGIGFIMIAAVFPIGLQQTKLTLDETTAAAAARGAAARLQQLGAAQVQYAVGLANVTGVMPRTYGGAVAVVGQTYPGQVRTFNDARDFADGGVNTPARRLAIWRTVASEMINPADARNATALMYKRDAVGVASLGGPVPANSGTAQLIAVNAQIGTQSEYVLTANTLALYDLEPRPVAVQVVYEPNAGNYVASFFSVTRLDGGGALDRGGYPNTMAAALDAAVSCVTEGAFVVISDDRATGPSAGRLNGRILRLGNRRPDLSGVTFDLAPGYAFVADPGVDGFLNSASPTSTDDLVAIGVDKNVTTLESGITYTSPQKVELPQGTNGPNGSGVTLAGTNTNKGAVALVLGRGFINPNATPVVDADYAGPAQDVSAYTTFVAVSNP